MNTPGKVKSEKSWAETPSPKTSDPPSIAFWWMHLALPASWSADWSQFAHHDVRLSQDCVSWLLPRVFLIDDYAYVLMQFHQKTLYNIFDWCDRKHVDLYASGKRALFYILAQNVPLYLKMEVDVPPRMKRSLCKKTSEDRPVGIRKRTYLVPKEKIRSALFAIRPRKRGHNLKRASSFVQSCRRDLVCNSLENPAVETRPLDWALIKFTEKRKTEKKTDLIRCFQIVYCQNMSE